MITYLIIRRSWPTMCICYWGPSGSGKSRHAYELGGDSQFWVARPRSRGQSVWWDGYEGHHTVVIDDFYGWMPRDLLYRLVDRYPLLVETKGGTVQFLAYVVIITSNQPPEMWWKLGLGSMERRLTPPEGYSFFVGNEGQSEDEYRATLRPAPVPGVAVVPQFVR